MTTMMRQTLATIRRRDVVNAQEFARYVHVRRRITSRYNTRTEKKKNNKIRRKKSKFHPFDKVSSEHELFPSPGRGSK